MKHLYNKWWYRENTNEWVWEFTINIPKNLYGNYRYTAKTKIGCIINFIIYSLPMFKDYFKNLL